MALQGLLKDSSVTMLLQLLRIGGGLALLPPLISTLGGEGYGLVALAVTVCSYASLLESAFTPALRNELNRAVSVHDNGALMMLHQVARTMAGLLGLAMLVLVACIGLAGRLHGFNGTAVAVTLVCAVTILAGAAGSISDCVHSAEDKLWRIRLAELVATLLGFLLAYLTRHAQAPALTVACLCLAPPLGRLSAWLLMRRREDVSKAFDLAATRAFFVRHRHDSMSFVALQLMQCGLSTFPVIFVSFRLSLADTTVYTLVARLVTAPSNFIIGLMPVVWPRITRLYSQGQSAALRRVLPLGAVAIAALLGLWGFVVLLLDEPLFHWFSKGTLPTPDSALIVFMGALVVVNAVVAWISTLLNAMGAFSSQLKPTTICLVVLCLLSFVLVRFQGMPGLALAAVLANGLCIAVPTYLQARSRLGEASSPHTSPTRGAT